MSFQQNTNKHECVDCHCVKKMGDFNDDDSWVCAPCWRETAAFEKQERKDWAKAAKNPQPFVIPSPPQSFPVLIAGESLWAEKDDNDADKIKVYERLNGGMAAGKYVGVWSKSGRRFVEFV
jgi:hypothetical protein